MDNQSYVEIVRYEGEEIVKRMGPMSERKADKVMDGADINLNHEDYFVRITTSVKLLPKI